MKKLTKNSGITLIALVITIIVLLILAGVTIMSVTGENGILSRSISAREETKKAQALEELKEKIMEVQIDKKGEATLQDIIDALESDTENSYTVSTELATITGELPDLADKMELYILYKDYWFKVNSKLEVTFVKDSDSNDNNVEENKEDENVVKISDKASLEDFRNKINSGEKFENKTIKLTANIDLGGSTENKWTPIGDTEEHAFTGTFDGDGHTIENLCISAEGTSQGLFGYNKGTIKNLGIASINIIASSEGESTDANIGFIAGYNSGTIANCYNEADVEFTGGYHVGGIVGYLYTNGKISECYNSGDILGTTEPVGGAVCGIVGYAKDNCRIEYCYNTGDITNHASGQNARAAGISNGGVVVESCYNTGTIILKQDDNPKTWPVSAGIVAQLNGSGGMYNCYNIGETKIETTRTSSLRNGSIAGWTQEDIENCYCWCSEGVEAVAEKYEDEKTIKCEVTVKSNKEDMKNIASELGENFKEDENEINYGYPILVWQDKQ